MNEKEQALYNSIVDGLRRQGWGRFEAEDEAMYRIKTREYQAAVQKENATKAAPSPTRETPMTDMLDKVARAIIKTHLNSDCWDSLTEEIYDEYLAMARAAIEAMREPSESMMWRGFDALRDESGSVMGPAPTPIYQAMIDAALSTKEE